MAEFQEVIKQYKRMCDNTDCYNCPFYSTTELRINKNDNSCNGLLLARPEVYEPLIMQWAAEHPEPVYPTWLEWLKSEGVVPYLDGLTITKYADDSFSHAHVNIKEIAMQPIPADIAEKLGIEPKEG